MKNLPLNCIIDWSKSVFLVLVSPPSLKSHGSCLAVFLKERTFCSTFVGQLHQEEIFSLTGNQLFPTSNSVLLSRVHLFCFSFQHLRAGSERWSWIRKGPRRGWGLLLHKLHTGGCQQRLLWGMYLWEDCISVLMEYL